MSAERSRGSILDKVDPRQEFYEAPAWVILFWLYFPALVIGAAFASALVIWG